MVHEGQFVPKFMNDIQQELIGEVNLSVTRQFQEKLL